MLCGLSDNTALAAMFFDDLYDQMASRFLIAFISALFFC